MPGNSSAKTRRCVVTQANRAPPADTRQDLEIFCTRPPRRVQKRLTTDDGVAPTSGTVALLGETLGLTTIEVRLPRLP